MNKDHKRNESSSSVVTNPASPCPSPKNAALPSQSLDSEATERNRLIQQLHGKNYETLVMFAYPDSLDSFCWMSKFPKGEYEIEWNAKSAVSEVITKEELDDFCKEISESSSKSMKNV